MKFHHSFISWWLCSAVSKYFHTKTILRMKALSRLLQRSADQWVLFFIWYFFWVFSYLIPFVWLPHTSYLSQAPNAVDFLFPFWSSFYLLCLVTFYLICSHWKVLNIFYSKFKNSRISPVVCQYSLQKKLKHIRRFCYFQLWCDSPLWTLAPSRLQHHQTKSNFDSIETWIIVLDQTFLCPDFHCKHNQTFLCSFLRVFTWRPGIWSTQHFLQVALQALQSYLGLRKICDPKTKYLVSFCGITYKSCHHTPYWHDMFP